MESCNFIYIISIAADYYGSNLLELLTPFRRQATVAIGNWQLATQYAGVRPKNKEQLNPCLRIPYEHVMSPNFGSNEYQPTTSKTPTLLAGSA